uniref:ditrans,polycis-polyprenyl diphosphate synthase [(2E,6E)-farnesyldiphosphate specific] n=1 Tax=Coccolithus braarudii TaxID=221442 RepID=A0A7S0LJ28_9EUKA|mmetsp:Transcript_43441/g.92458  ORF Transcript_43441/g.92458 Transcript_43441/m.92458 type:complete len:243 (+) Transcript_43441:118-846(+)
MGTLRHLLLLSTLRVVHGVFAMYGALLAVRQFLCWLFSPSRSVAGHTYSRLPPHIGVVLGTGELLDVNALCRLIGWAHDAGINCFTLCDFDGSLERSAKEMRTALSIHCTPAVFVHTRTNKEQHTTIPDCVDHINICLASLQSGRDEMVDLARSMCEASAAKQLDATSIDEASVQAWLAQTHFDTELALVLQFCDEHLLGGLPPWQIRNSHFVHMGCLQRCSQARLHTALLEFDSLQQRHGT